MDENLQLVEDCENRDGRLNDWERQFLLPNSLAHLGPATAPLVLEICSLPDEIRGYEEIKMRSVKRFRMTAERLERKLARAGGLEAAA